jgi:hypothetical protein
MIVAYYVDWNYVDYGYKEKNRDLLLFIFWSKFFLIVPCI